jgi:hypothetical protein
MGALGLLGGGCVHRSSAHPDSAPSLQPILKAMPDDGKAAESANAFLRQQGLDWGQPTQILRTVVQWYRIEYARGPAGSERVVLVNPKNGAPEFPLPR